MKVNLTIDGKKLAVPKGTTVIEAAKEAGIEIPALCYDKNLEIVSACRLCIVEVVGSKKLETSCSTFVREGMEVRTMTQKVIEARKEIIQLLLDSHPNDCLTCQKAGECLLQKYAYEYDLKFRDHGGAMRPTLIDTSSPYILKDDSKCILCGKCVRTCAQVEGRHVLSFSGRGYDTRIVMDADQSFEESTCVSCNRCVAVCPVGALVDKRQLGKIRAWEGEIKRVKCKSCTYGCTFELVKKGEKVVAVRAYEPSGGRPLCLKGRLHTELNHMDKPDKPYLKKMRKFVETSWAEALELDEILEKIDKLDQR